MTTSIGSFFHKSGIRTKELNETAEKNNLDLVRFPEHFEVRWTQFSLQSVISVIKSWNALVIYFQKSKEVEAKGYLSFLTDKNNLYLLTFLADVLEIFSRFQKNLQRDTITLIDMIKYVKSTTQQLQALLQKPLIGGWVEALDGEMKISPKNNNCNSNCQDNADDSDNNIYELKGVILNVGNRRLKTHNKYVSVQRDTNAVQNEIIQSLDNFLKIRFDQDEENMIESFEKFSKFQATADLKTIHKFVASDLDLSTLNIEFEEIINIGLAEKMENFSIVEKIKNLIKLDNYQHVTKTLARIAAAKPHSADVERLISCNNILKDSHRCSLDVETENLYLYVYFNMPDLESWDPRPAVVKWIETKERRNKKTEKAQEQRWFKGIFQQNVTQEKKKENDGMTKKSVPKKKCF